MRDLSNISLLPYNTFGIDVKAKRFIEYYSLAELRAVLKAYRNEQILDIVDTPVSQELLPTDDNGQIAQKTEDKIGPYELHDFFMYYFLRYGFTREKIAYMATLAFEDQFTEDEIVKWLNVFMHRFFTQQFKRSCMPDGPKVVPVGLSPRGDLRMPSDVCEI